MLAPLYGQDGGSRTYIGSYKYLSCLFCRPRAERPLIHSFTPAALRLASVLVCCKAPREGIQTLSFPLTLPTRDQAPLAAGGRTALLGLHREVSQPTAEDPTLSRRETKAAPWESNSVQSGFTLMLPQPSFLSALTTPSLAREDGGIWNGSLRPQRTGR